MLDLQWQRAVERESERARGNYLIEENFDREKFGVFFRFCHFFAMKCFPE